MHIIPIGPIGTAIANPIISPFKKKIGSMLFYSDQLVAVDTVKTGAAISSNILIIFQTCPNILRVYRTYFLF
jgi:hypothetical protein